jgi:hypothetical protein
LILCAILIAPVYGCGQPGSARFVVDDIQKHEECLSRMFPFEPIFFAARERAESVGIFLQSRGGNFQSVDIIHFEVFNPDDVQTGVSIPVDSTVTRDSQAVGSLQLGESCPELRDSLAVSGSIVFNSFSREVNGLMSAEFEGQIVSLTDDDVVAGSLSGDFDFTVELGQPYEEFRK